MTSTVDSTFPADNVKTSKATMRSQFLIISNEITALQQRTGVAGSKAYYNFITPEEVDVRISRVRALSLGIPRTIAYGSASI
jgi:hypothetical protein|tara:strand:+ start:1207 stop:1452 length:246 start_codon:yes stop_codon:yes gene_type:complete